MENNSSSRNFRPALEIQSTGDGSHTLYRADLDETYHSHKGAVGESEYVFIEKGLTYMAQSRNQPEITIFEVGLGTGLNALLSAKFAAEQSIKVRFHTVEPIPVPKDIYRQLNYAKNDGDRKLLQDIHESRWDEEVAISDYFHLYKSPRKLEEFDAAINVDVVYMDAFAPSKQADIWALPNLEKCYQLCRPGGVLVTYCAQGQFKRDLKTCGFQVEVLPGALGKKEMVRAIKSKH